SPPPPDTHPLSLHDALPICPSGDPDARPWTEHRLPCFDRAFIAIFAGDLTHIPFRRPFPDNCLCWAHDGDLARTSRRPIREFASEATGKDLRGRRWNSPTLQVSSRLSDGRVPYCSAAS